MRTIRGSLLVAMVLLVGACSDDGGSSDEAGSPGGDAAGGDAAGAEAPEFELISEGTLSVCTDAPYPPFEFEEDGEFTGYDMDILRAVAENLGLELEVSVVPFDGIWLKPAAGDCDLVGSAMTITPERAEQALFSDPYFDADQSLMIRVADEAEYATLEDLDGATIGVQTGTTGEDYAEENAPDGAEIQSLDEPAALFLALESEEIDAILQDFPVNLDRANQNPDLVVTESFATGEQYGFAVSQDNEGLAEAVNQQLEALREDGTFDAIFEEYFPGAEPS